MTTDKKTLADVQPGGRVRLGDQVLSTSEGARRYVADFFATQLGRHDFGDYILTELAADFACALAQQLSAHSSQGGQDAPVTDEMVVAACMAGSDGYAYGSSDWRERCEVTMREALEAALAASQPVCQTCEKEGVFADDGSGPWDCYTCGKKAARQPVGNK